MALAVDEKQLVTAQRSDLRPVATDRALTEVTLSHHGPELLGINTYKHTGALRVITTTLMGAEKEPITACANHEHQLMVLPGLIWILTRLYFIHHTNRRSCSLEDVYQTRFYICLWSEHSGIDRQAVGVVVLRLARLAREIIFFQVPPGAGKLAAGSSAQSTIKVWLYYFQVEWSNFISYRRGSPGGPVSKFAR
ncbi:hypothetical protein C8R48DRAFT_675765 [Suillus tomentosus]|nr:hypothetical protein C8R48DRAFT_675765 [Suillus tomentosus]